ncbi:LuxR C-terminal-related transcriptional regulator [Streptomyces collinus]|uniref:helix-turn-helix transcriptional regulator n=1 Tax=Streptomyces collinus TaxID=42684 RepID=UPI00341671DE
MTIEADLPLLSSVPESSPNTVRHISRREPLDWLFQSAAAPVIEIRGDRWTGKSELLARLSAEAARHGWSVASGTASAQPFRSISLGLFMDALDEPLAGTGLPDDPFGRYQAFRAVRNLLESLSPAGGMLLALDDVHRADEASVDLLSYLLRHPPAGRVVLALAHRPRQTDPGLRNLLDQAAARQWAHRLTPAVLDPQEALALLPDDLSRSQRERMLDVTEHNPGLLKALGSTRSLLGADGRALPSLPLHVLTETLRDFASLSPASWLVVRAAAVLGEPSDPAALGTVAQVSDEELRAAVDELTREDLLRTEGASPLLGFGNPALRAAAYQSAGPGWLFGAHARAARLLAARDADAVRLAEHLQYGAALGDRDSAQILLTAAGLRQWSDPQRSAAWSGAALALGLSDEDAARARLQLGGALTLCGRLREAMDVLGPLTRAGGTGGTGLDAAHWYAQALRLTGAHEGADRVLAAALDRAASAGPEQRAGLLAARIALALDTARPVPDGPVTALLSTAEHLGPVARAGVYALSAAAALRSASGEHADFHAVAAARLLDRAADDAVLPHVEGLYWLAGAEAALGRHNAAHRHYERGLRLAESGRLRVLAPRFASALAGLAPTAGRDLPPAAEAAEVPGARAAATPATPSTAATATAARAATAAATVPTASESAPPPGPAESTGPAGSSEPAEAAASAASELSRLSKRELEIAVLVSGGRTNQQIARSLEVSHKTVETHMGRIFKKLVVSSRAEVAAMVGRSDRGPEAGR